MRFDVNHMVKVRLTPLGKAHLEADHAALCGKLNRSLPYTPPEEDEDGWSMWQLWRLMAAFGAHLGPDFDPPFESEIELVI